MLYEVITDATGELPLFERLHRPSPGPAVACFRPTSVRFEPYDALMDAADAVWMQGLIMRSEFRGGYLRYSVSVGEETVVCDLPHRKATLALPAGSRITSYNVCYTKLLRSVDLYGSHPGELRNSGSVVIDPDLDDNRLADHLLQADRWQGIGAVVVFSEEKWASLKATFSFPILMAH